MKWLKAARERAERRSKDEGKLPRYNLFNKNNTFIENIIESDDESDDSNSESDELSESNTVRQPFRDPLMINIAYTQYPVVKEWAKVHKMKITK